jgi:hypothetical protein
MRVALAQNRGLDIKLKWGAALITCRRYWQAWPSSTSYWNALQWSQVRLH